MNISHLQSLIIVSGTSGAGKAKSLDALADFGYFNVENLPVSAIPSFIEHTQLDPSRYARIAILPEIRSIKDVELLISLIKNVSNKNILKLIYLDCRDEVLIRRYSETRRPHPLFDSAKDKTINDAIKSERSILGLFREASSILFDTSNWNIHELRRALLAFVESLSYTNSQVFRINFLSFGFKYGLPGDCDIVMDARFLPNPYFVPELRELDGTDSKVSEYVLNTEATQKFINLYEQLLNFSLPLYIDAGKQYLNVGIGCTGGKHRSVALAEEFSKKLSGPGLSVSAKHRDYKNI
jgi:UPF0042 nucleotide-binding protein